MGRLHLEFFDKKSIYECVECEAHFTHTGVLVSKVGRTDGVELPWKQGEGVLIRQSVSLRGRVEST